MDVDLYLNRIGISKQLEPNLSNLGFLQSQHLLNIPFENLDLFHGKYISLDYGAQFDKLIQRNRGGFCFELNSQFYQLLKALGYDCQLIAAQTWSEESESLRPKFDHMAICVNFADAVNDLNNKYIADVGFGAFTMKPLKLALNEEQLDACGSFKILPFKDETAIYKRVDSEWKIEYVFNLSECQLSDFEEMCHNTQTQAGSHFLRNKMITIVTEIGRVTLTDSNLKSTKNGIKTELPVIDEGHFYALLLEHFGIAKSSLLA